MKVAGHEQRRAASGALRWKMKGSTSLAAIMAGLVLLSSPHVGMAAENAAGETARQIEFSIPAGTLDEALKAFAAATGIEPVYEAEMVEGKSSGGLSGSMTAADGLSRLLAGSSLSGAFTSGDTVLISGAAAVDSAAAGADGDAMTLGPVVVEGRNLPPRGAEIGTLPPAWGGGNTARGSKVGVLGNKDVMDTPYSATSYTSELADKQGAQTVGEFLKNDPSVREATSGGYTIENFRMRGFDLASGDLALNGSYGLLPSGSVPMEAFERVEVIRGASGMLMGVPPNGSVAGVVNLVPKRAHDDPVRDVVVDYTSGSQVGGRFDMGERFGDNNEFGVRVNGMYRGGDTGVEGQYKGGQMASVALDYQGERFRASVDAIYSRRTTEGGSPMMPNVSGLAGVPDAPDANVNIFPGFEGEQESAIVTARAELDLHKDVTAWVGGGLHSEDWDGDLSSTQPTVTNMDGDYSVRHANRKDVNHSRSIDAGVRGKLETGPVTHDLVASLNSVTRESGVSLTVTTGAGNIYEGGAMSAPVDYAEPAIDRKVVLSGIALGDTVSAFDDRLQVTLGMRRQNIRQKSYQADGQETSSYDKSDWTPTVGLVVKPWDDRLSVYGNYIEALAQGGEVTDATKPDYGRVFDPYVSTQMEVGVKYDGGNFGTNLAFFELTKKTLTEDTVTEISSLGSQRNRGFELTTYGEVIEGVSMQGGVTYIDADMTEHGDPSVEGKTAYGVPKFQGTVGAEWALPMVEGLKINGRGTYTGAMYANSTNTLEVPDWWIMDVGANYTFPLAGQDITLNGYVSNLLDRDYWSGALRDGYLTVGEGRKVNLSAKVSF